MAILVGGWAFGEITENVIEREELENSDIPVTLWLVGRRVGWLTVTMRAATWLGSAWLVVPLLTAAVVLFPVGGRRWSTLGTVTAVMAGTILLVHTVKVLIGRARPDIVDVLTSVSSYAFPSAHSAQAVAAYGALAWLIAARVSRWHWKAAAWGVAALVAAVVGFSRLYLGVHWLTDVLGGQALAGTWLAMVLGIHGAVARLTRADGIVRNGKR